MVREILSQTVTAHGLRVAGAVGPGDSPTMPKPYRVAIIGSTGRGDYGHGLDVCWLELPNVTIVGLADDDPKGLARAADRLGVAASFGDYHRMLDETRPQIVSIGPRWIDRHSEWASAALDRGIHVYLEKPCCRSLVEADQIIRAGEMTHAKLALAHTTRYSPVLARVRELIDADQIGQVLELRGRGKEDARGGGEDLWVLGSHIFNLFTTIAGPAEWCFATVREGGEPIARRHVREGNEGLGPLAGDDVRATLGFAGGVTATFQSVRNTAGTPSRFGVQIHGSKGIIEITTGYLPAARLLADSSWSPGRSGAVWQEITSAGLNRPEPLVGASPQAGNVAAIVDLIDAIEVDREPLCSARDGRATVEMILAVFESARLGKPVRFPLELVGHPLEQLA